MLDSDMERIEDLEVYREWLDAQNRTGPTIALCRARQRLPVLLSMRPDTVEAFMRSRMDAQS